MLSLSRHWRRGRASRSSSSRWSRCRPCSAPRVRQCVLGTRHLCDLLMPNSSNVYKQRLPIRTTIRCTLCVPRFCESRREPGRLTSAKYAPVPRRKVPGQAQAPHASPNPITDDGVGRSGLPPEPLAYRLQRSGACTGPRGPFLHGPARERKREKIGECNVAGPQSVGPGASSAGKMAVGRGGCSCAKCLPIGAPNLACLLLSRAAEFR